MIITAKTTAQQLYDNGDITKCTFKKMSQLPCLGMFALKTKEDCKALRINGNVLNEIQFFLRAAGLSLKGDAPKKKNRYSVSRKRDDKPKVIFATEMAAPTEQKQYSKKQAETLISIGKADMLKGKIIY